MTQQIKDNFYRPTRVEINLSAIEHNLNQVKKRVGDCVKILAVIKADAYGHGAVRVAGKLRKCGVDYFGVATVLEAIELRKNKINTPILLLTALTYHEFSAVVHYKITPTIADLNTAISFNRKLKKVGKKISVHIKIDTGMGRIGVWHKEALDFIKNLAKLNNLKLEGIYTHFPSADEDEKFTNSQLESFNILINSLEREGISIPIRHAANSIAVIRYRRSYLNLVRPGLMLYGLYPDEESKKPLNLKPAMLFKTKITYLKDVVAGRSISYGRTFTTKRRAKIATIPVGYADGYNRLLSNKADVLVRGRRCRVVGRVCMDHTMIDVTGIGAELGDDVILIGRQKNLEISAEELSKLCLTIPYEVVCWISRRVPRVYID